MEEMEIGKGIASIALCMLAMVATLTIVGIVVVPFIIDVIKDIWEA